VKAVPKVAAILCNIQTQGLLNGFIELTYPPDGGGGGGGGGGGNTPDQNTLILVAGVGLIAAAFIIFWRSSRAWLREQP
jgi:LPXTG-motif cell wall-anchored protein